MASYFEKLKHPKWQQMRLKVLERDKFRCTYCNSDDKTLHVHHTWYEKGRDPWEYPEDSLETVCKDCHKEWHDLKLTLDQEISEGGTPLIEALIGFVRAVSAETHRDRAAQLPDMEITSWEMAWGVAQVYGIGTERIMANLENDRISIVDLIAIQAGCKMRDGVDA